MFLLISTLFSIAFFLDHVVKAAGFMKQSDGGKVVQYIPRIMHTIHIVAYFVDDVTVMNENL